MVKRECPRCKRDVYSAAEQEDWVCPYPECGAIIPFTKEQQHEGVSTTIAPAVRRAEHIETVTREYEIYFEYLTPDVQDDLKYFYGKDHPDLENVPIATIYIEEPIVAYCPYCEKGGTERDWEEASEKEFTTPYNKDVPMRTLRETTEAWREGDYDLKEELFACPNCGQLVEFARIYGELGGNW